METDFGNMNIAELQHMITQVRERLKERAREIDAMPYINTEQSEKTNWSRYRSSPIEH